MPNNNIESFINCIESSSSSSNCSSTPFLDLSLQISPPNSTTIIESSNNEIRATNHHHYTHKFHKINNNNNGVWLLDHHHHGSFPFHPHPSFFSSKDSKQIIPTSPTFSSSSSSSKFISCFTPPPPPRNLRFQLDPGRPMTVARGRCVRSPRMRWTSSLHAQFVHAVELLGGHESNKLKSHIYIYIYILYIFKNFYLFIFF